MVDNNLNIIVDTLQLLNVTGKHLAKRPINQRGSLKNQRNDVSSSRKANSSSNNTTATSQISTPNPIYEYSEEISAIAEHNFAERRQTLADGCAKWQLADKYPPNAWEFFISPGHGLAWCNIFKAASSAWLYNFNILGKSSFCSYRQNFIFIKKFIQVVTILGTCNALKRHLSSLHANGFHGQVLVNSTKRYRTRYRS